MEAICFDFYIRECIDVWEAQPFATESGGVHLLDTIHSSPAFTQVLDTAPWITCVIDMHDTSYLYVSRNVFHLLGFTSEEFMRAGPAEMMHRMPPEDVIPYTRGARIWLEFLLAQPPHRRKQYQCSVDLRWQRKDGNYIRILQQNTVLQQDSQGNVTHMLMSFTNISHLQKEGPVSAVVYSTTDETYFSVDFRQNVLQPLPHKFSRREKEVLRLMAEGFRSKEIAGRLSISELTVNTHRKNMLEKTGSRNATELIRLAMGFGLI